jgi:hypothetical protein
MHLTAADLLFTYDLLTFCRTRISPPIYIAIHPRVIYRKLSSHNVNIVPLIGVQPLSMEFASYMYKARHCAGTN